MKQNLLQKLFALALVFFTLHGTSANISVTTDVTASTTWTNNNIYVLYGDIIVKSGVTLTIQEGTIIKGDKATTSRLVVARGAKLIAQGTPEQPIVFTSNQAAGTRARGDWAGLAICGRAPVNFLDANGVMQDGNLECGNNLPDYKFGGSDPADNSGVISYVRIEYAGYICQGSTELNSLTMGGVGSGTKLDHVMVSYGQDDGFEWFGGTVNANHLISFAQRDDDFDTDNGFAGQVQHGLVVRIDTIADQGDRSNAFESDNDANSSYNFPYTKGVFTNITVVGPAQTTSSTVDPKYGWAARLRRNTGLSIFNSVFIGYNRGLWIDGPRTEVKATSDTLEFKYNIIAGTKEAYAEKAFDTAYLANPATSNTVIGGNANDAVNLVSPFGNPDNYNFLPQQGSPALSGANFTNAKLSGLTTTTYRGAFGTNDWKGCWAEFSPQDENYTAGPINYGFALNISQSGSLPLVTLTADNIAGATYNWSTGSTSASISVTAAGNYIVTVTGARGCTKVVTAVVGSVGIEDMQKTIQAVNLQPNPNTGLAALEISSTQSSDVAITVIDITGRELMIMNKELVNGINRVAIDTKDFSSGLYFINVRSGSENNVVRMVVNN